MILRGSTLGRLVLLGTLGATQHLAQVAPLLHQHQVGQTRCILMTVAIPTTWAVQNGLHHPS